jgi:pilus assembly protein CpaF
VDTAPTRLLHQLSTVSGLTPRERAGSGIVLTMPELATQLWSRIPGRLPPGLRRDLGDLADLVDDPRVTDIFVLGSGAVFVDTGEGATVVRSLSLQPHQGAELARRLIEAGGRHLDEAQPVADVNLGHGIRVHAVVEPICASGAEISVRIHRNQRPALERLGLANAATVVPRLISAVHQRATLLITGATGSGKTTLLSALMAHAAPTERLLVLEDLAEIAIDHPHVISLECRAANIEGAGEITLTRLVREALRMKPTRLIVGECRGAELADLLQAFHTGHRGGATTIHAHSVAEVPTRLDAIGSMAGLSETQLARHAAGAFDLVVHLEHRVDGLRHISTGHLVLTAEGRLDVELDS